MSTRNKIMIGVFVALCVVSAVLVAVGVATHEEPGVMGVCFSTQGTVIRYEVNGAEECEPLEWPRDQVPIRVEAVYARGLAPFDPVSATRSAIDLINTRLGFDLFVYGEDSDVMVIFGIPSDVGVMESSVEPTVLIGGDTEISRFEGVTAASIRILNTGTIGITHRVLVHELLHAAGLAHDPFESSVMHPDTDTSEPRVIRAPWITDSDRATLRALYAPP